MRFTKMEGLGNDYVYLDCTQAVPQDLPQLAREVSDRHFGVGSDGLICICASQIADFQMVMFNADGSQAEMCGNGIRCVGKFVYDKGLTDKTELTIETLAGVKALDLTVVSGKVEAVTVDMGAPEIGEERTITAGGQEFHGVPVSVGNPHFVIQADAVKDFPLSMYAPLSIPNPAFPEGVNVEIVEVLTPDHVKMRVWERGSGETLACGTGATATVAACASQALTGRDVKVSLLGGDLRIRWDEGNGHLYMTGPARTVFEGEWPDKAML